ncbi:MAG: class I SAM-dependent methyltransferase [Alphaproteobacteria bacterium]
MLLETLPHLVSKTFLAQGWGDYALLDSGYGRKLERFKAYTVNRPEPQAMWMPRLSESVWEQADASFTGAEEEGNWRFLEGDRLEPWCVSYQNLALWGKFTSFRHVGYFPEQLPHWQFIEAFLKTIPEASVLNLFAYTGMASLVAAAQGARVTHVDASEKAIGWAIENQRLSRLEDAPIRWICEDAIKFAAREGRRGKAYHLILLDPPKFGRGPGKEVWDLFYHLPQLLEHCLPLLEVGGCLILNTYALRLSHTALKELLADVASRVCPQAEVEINSGDLAIREEGQGECQGRVIPQSMFGMLHRKS